MCRSARCPGARHGAAARCRDPPAPADRPDTMWHRALIEGPVPYVRRANAHRLASKMIDEISCCLLLLQLLRLSLHASSHTWANAGAHSSTTSATEHHLSISLPRISEVAGPDLVHAIFRHIIRPFDYDICRTWLLVYLYDAWCPYLMVMVFTGKRHSAHLARKNHQDRHGAHPDNINYYQDYSTSDPAIKVLAASSHHDDCCQPLAAPISSV